MLHRADQRIPLQAHLGLLEVFAGGSRQPYPVAGRDLGTGGVHEQAFRGGRVIVPLAGRLHQKEAVQVRIHGADHGFHHHGFAVQRRAVIAALDHGHRRVRVATGTQRRGRIAAVVTTVTGPFAIDAQAVQGVLGKSPPLVGGVEGVIDHGVAGGDGFQPAQGLVGAGDIAAAPGAARVLADTAEAVHHPVHVAEHVGVVAVVADHAAADIAEPVQRRAGLAADDHQYRPGRQALAVQLEHAGGVGAAVGVAFQAVAVQADGVGAAVIQLQGLVKAAAFHILTDQNVRVNATGHQGAGDYPG